MLKGIKSEHELHHNIMELCDCICCNRETHLAAAMIRALTPTAATRREPNGPPRRRD
jgi:hypothetical protein